MKKHLFLLLALCVTAVCSAQESNAKAKAIIDKAIAQIQRSAQQFEFTTNYISGKSGEKTFEKGTCALSGRKIFVTFAGVETYFDGKTQWVYMPKNNEVSISEPTDEELKEVNPLLLVRDYAKSHRVDFDDVTDEHYHALCLYPMVGKRAEYFRIKVLIDKRTYQIHSIEFCQRNADHIILTVKSQQELPKDFSFAFDFGKHKGVETNDLR